MPRGPQEEEITLDDQLYKIRKFNPSKACKWMFRLFGSMSTIQSEADFIQKVETFTSMPEKDFIEFQKDCLECVTAIFPAAPYPLVNPDGTYIVPNIEAPTIFELTMRAFMFGIIDFFEPSKLGRLRNLFQPMMKTDSPPAAPDQASPSP